MALIEGTPFNDYLLGDIFGFPEDDHIYGYDGQDTLDGLAGADTMDGGDGDDTYYVDNVGDKTGEVWNDSYGGVDTVYASATHTIGYGIEHLTLTGLNDINGTGNENNNVITGNSGNNVLKGLNGKDTLIGNDGKDQLFGGAGNDILQDAVNSANPGKDYLDGGTGADTMDGGDDSDTYIVDNALDVVKEQYNDTTGGVDLVKSSVSYTLSHMDFGIENLTLTGSAHINGTGNGNHNVITGNSGNNVLKGLAGDDTLIGGGGKDTLTGGTGHDKFVYKSVSDSPAGAGRDVITDFKGNGSGIGDKIDLKGIDANVTKSGNQDFIFGGPHTAGHVWYSGGLLNGNIDNDAAVEFQIQLTGAPAVHVTDIIL